MRKVLFLIVFYIFIWQVNSEGLKSIDEAKTIIQTAINVFSDEHFKEGLDYLKPYWNESPFDIDEVASRSQEQWPAVRAKFGKKIGIEALKPVVVGDSLLKLIVLVKFEKAPLRFEISLYRGLDGWTIINFTFDDQILKLLD